MVNIKSMAQGCHSSIAPAQQALRLALLLVIMLVLGCTPPKGSRTTLSGQTMGTSYTIHLDRGPDQDKVTTAKRREIQQKIDTLLQGINQSMSTYRVNSEISRFNGTPAHTKFAISEDFARVVRMALSIQRRSLGYYNITVNPLVELWGFGNDKSNRRLPQDKEIAQALKRVGRPGLTLSQTNSQYLLSKSKEGLTIDLSSVAKGYAVDRVSELLRQAGFSRFMMELGGEIRVSGRSYRGKPWRIAIQHPRAGLQPQGPISRTVPLTDKAMATSGDYRNYFEIEGRRYSHTLNPKTGRPVRHSLASVTVLHNSCAQADAWATALLAMGAERALALAKRLDLAVYLIQRKGRGAKGYTVLPSPRFRDRYASN